MKRIAITFALLACAAGAMAQMEGKRWSITPTIGVNRVRSDILEEHTGYSVGVLTDYKLAGQWSVALGVDYQRTVLGSLHLKNRESLGVAHWAGVATGRSKLNGVELKANKLGLPLLCRYYPLRDVAVMGGIEVDIWLGGSRKDAWDDVFRELAEQQPSGPEYRIDDVRTNTVMWSVPVGVMYEYRRWVIDIRYLIGLTRERVEEATHAIGVFPTPSYGTSRCDGGRQGALQLRVGRRF